MEKVIRASLLVFMVFSTFGISCFNNAHGASSMFMQTDWIGGQSADVVVGAINQTGWDKYFIKDSSVAVGADVTINAGSLSVTRTTDIDFGAGVGNGTIVSGSGDGASVALSTAGATGISSGPLHSCAISNDDSLFCWGHNASGNLGINNSVPSNIPVRVLGGDQGSTYFSNIVQVENGGISTCARTNDKALYCWGANGNGEIGDDSTISRRVPTRVKGGEQGGTYLADVKQVSMKKQFVCAVTDDGSVYCWGNNYYGALGNNTKIESHVPIKVLGGAQGGAYLSDIKSVSVGEGHACAVTNAGAVYCWGYNENGKLGDATSVEKLTPVRVRAGAQGGTYLANAQQIEVNAGYSCALTSDKGVYCWGYSPYGGIGVTSTGVNNVPAKVIAGAQGGTYMTNVEQISLGQYFACARVSDGSVYCWGRNTSGQLGNNSITNSNSPVKVLGGAQGGAYLNSVEKMKLGWDNVCVIVTDGSAYCWGVNTSGGLGDNTITERHLPVKTRAGAQGGTYLNTHKIVSVTSGDFISSPIDFSMMASVGTLAFDVTTPTNTEIKFQIAGNNDNNTWNFIGPDGTAPTYFNSSGMQIPLSLNGNRYFKYKVYLSRTDVSAVALLNNITLTYYPMEGTIISSKFDTGSMLNTVSGVSWSEDENLPASSQVSLSLRASSSESGLESAAWSNIGISTPSSLIQGCIKSTTNVVCDSTTIPNEMKVAGGNRWFQYKISLSGAGGQIAPTLSGVAVFYDIISSPAVDTGTISDITQIMAVASGNIVTVNGENPTRSIEWGTTQGSNYTNSCSAGTGGTGVYSCAMTSLTPGTTYYVRAKATNSAGTSYGEEVSFTTLSAQAAVTTDLVTNMLTTAATGNATITDIGGENPMREIQWGTQSNTYTNSCSANIGAIGSYSCQITNLTPGTTYYARSIATNSAGSSYGEETSFTTLPSQVTISEPDITKMTNSVSSNYMSVSTGSITNTLQVTTNTNIIFQDGIVKMDVPTNTQITKTDSGNFNFQNFITESATNIVKQTIPNSISAVKVGVVGTKISFSQPITLTIDVDSGYNGRTLDVLYQNDGETDWHSQTSCTITAGKCIFQTNHATTYSVNGSGNMAGETGINLNTDVQEVISLDCGNSTINLGNLTPGTPITGSSTCTATTNANGGYNLAVKRDDATSTLKKNSENSIIISDLTPWDPTTPNSNTWSGTGLGFTVYNSTANKNSAWWGIGTTLTDSNNRYAGFATTQTDIMRNATYAATSTATDIGYMLNVPPTQKSGAYSGSVTYQVVTTP